MKAEIIPTEIRPRMANMPPKKAIITKPILPMVFMIGPMMPLSTLAFMPMSRKASDLALNSAMASS